MAESRRPGLGADSLGADGGGLRGKNRRLGLFLFTFIVVLMIMALIFGIIY